MVSTIGFGGDTGNQSEPWMSWDFNSSRRIFSIVGGGSGTLSNALTYYFPLCFQDGSAYQVTSGKTFRSIGIYRMPGVLTAGASVYWGLGSGTSAAIGSVSAPTSAALFSLGVDHFPSTANANYYAMRDSLYLPIFVEFSSTKYPFAHFLPSAANTESSGGIILMGYEY